MKVTAYKTVDVECECDVCVEDLLNEFIVEISQDEAGPNRLTAYLDAITRILARVTPEQLARIRPEPRAELLKRLEVEVEKYRIK